MREGGRHRDPEDEIHPVAPHVSGRLQVHGRHGPKGVGERSRHGEKGPDDRHEQKACLGEAKQDQSQGHPGDRRESLEPEDVGLDALAEGREMNRQEREDRSEDQGDEETDSEAHERRGDGTGQGPTNPEIVQGPRDSAGARQEVRWPNLQAEDEFPKADEGHRDHDHGDQVQVVSPNAGFSVAIHRGRFDWFDHWTSAFKISFDRRICSTTSGFSKVLGRGALFVRTALTVPGRWDRTTIRPPRTAASRTSCVTNRVVVPLRSHRSWTTDCISSRVCTSRAANGSSMSRTCGRKTRARARATRCFIPPDSSCTRAWGKFSSWTIRMYSSTRASRSPRRTPATRNPNEMFPQTSSHGKTAPSWKTTIRSAPGPWTRCPSISTQPVVGSSRPATILSRVDLPQPEGPTIVTNSPSPIWRLMSRRASVGSVSPLNRLPTMTSFSAAPFMFRSPAGVPSLRGSHSRGTGRTAKSHRLRAR